MKRVLNIGIIASFVAWPLAAQQHQHQGAGERPTAMTHCEMMAGGMMSGGMMGMSMEAMRLTPSHVLNQREALQFTTEQTMKLEVIGAEMSSMRNHMMAPTGDAEAVASAFRAQPVDSAAMNQALQRMAGHRAAMHERHLLVAARVREVLTADQLEKLESLPSPCRMGDRKNEGEHEHGGQPW